MKVHQKVEKFKWINGSNKADNQIFDTEFEAKEWTESLYSDFAAYISKENNVGYATPDEKVINYLISHFPQWADFNHLIVDVCTEKINKEGQTIYKIRTLNI
ncbi:hypothetical protein [Cytobacillus massiliigabonensis]|uniref:hypothetical protein n=1 Tax=Cytobacillus massiliigabonensis TaxID=1871011 RepID=UPI000C8626AD|nr:hypothetical protein [Cytobacillus massiliigabonensis]